MGRATSAWLGGTWGSPHDTVGSGSDSGASELLLRGLASQGAGIPAGLLASCSFAGRCWALLTASAPQPKISAAPWLLPRAAAALRATVQQQHSSGLGLGPAWPCRGLARLSPGVWHGAGRAASSSPLASSETSTGHSLAGGVRAAQNQPRAHPGAFPGAAAPRPTPAPRAPTASPGRRSRGRNPPPAPPRPLAPPCAQRAAPAGLAPAAQSRTKTLRARQGRTAPSFPSPFPFPRLPTPCAGRCAGIARRLRGWAARRWRCCCW